MEKGFLFTAGNKQIFIKSELTRKTDTIARQIIDTIGELRNVPQETLERAKQDKATLEDFKRRTDKATLEFKDTGKIVYYTITGKYFTENFPEKDFKESVIVL